MSGETPDRPDGCQVILSGVHDLPYQWSPGSEPEIVDPVKAFFQDVSEVPDVEVESVLVKLYAAEASEFITKGCLNLLGLRAAMEDSK